MTRVICDICDKVIDSDRYLITIKNYNMSSCGAMLDMCEECRRALFEDWVMHRKAENRMIQKGN